MFVCLYFRVLFHLFQTKLFNFKGEMYSCKHFRNCVRAIYCYIIKETRFNLIDRTSFQNAFFHSTDQQNLFSLFLSLISWWYDFY